MKMKKRADFYENIDLWCRCDWILDAALTPRMIQPTTFAEISGNKSEKTKQFYDYMKKLKEARYEIL
ncbi:hypothetical protein [Dorea formicigenerans]|uniref:hypothetical protein n=1 Tax=Dorea formicigenerans TaxID=39486 RepID=UPI001FA86BE5|nr:hypothetical protein [Dorea formicigenerans]